VSLPPSASRLTNAFAEASLAVFAPGSQHTSASLVEALESFEQGLPRANEIIRGIKADLAGAVDTCIEAAGLEPDPVWQKKLLRVRDACFWEIYVLTRRIGGDDGTVLSRLV
jgi:hypothetical protein